MRRDSRLYGEIFVKGLAQGSYPLSRRLDANTDHSTRTSEGVQRAYWAGSARPRGCARAPVAPFRLARAVARIVLARIVLVCGGNRNARTGREGEHAPAHLRIASNVGIGSDEQRADALGSRFGQRRVDLGTATGVDTD